jgi:dGTPase
MEWARLLSQDRLGGPPASQSTGPRTEFQRDFDRIIFSSAFRRLQDKTQVFPLAKNDYVRTRLTHSLEVASVGRSLGVLAGDVVLARHPGLRPRFSADDFGAIVAAACLAHDIGNPPFGHAGEAAIQDWFRGTKAGNAATQGLAPAEANDLLHFEGNAQGFRILARLQNPDNEGGMQLTCATLGAFMKYPRSSFAPQAGRRGGASVRKHGFMEADRSLFENVAAVLGLKRQSGAEPAWHRHPLAFLMEAADDICYRIIDVEDGYRAGQLTFEEIEPLFHGLIADPEVRRKAASIATDEKRVEYLRARAINAAIEDVSAVFRTQEPGLLSGEWDRDLVSEMKRAGALEAFKNLAARRVYRSAPVIGIETPGFSVLGSLLESFVGAGTGLFPEGPEADPYQRILKVTDYISGMTDSFAVDLFRKAGMQ